MAKKQVSLAQVKISPATVRKRTPLKITKVKKVNGRTGEDYFTWKLSKNKKPVNHHYNTRAGRNTQLNNFIKDIKEGNYVIEDFS